MSGAGRQLFVLIVAYLCIAVSLPSPTVPGIGGFLPVTQGDSCQLAQLTLSPCVAALVISFNLSVHAYVRSSDAAWPAQVEKFSVRRQV